MSKILKMAVCLGLALALLFVLLGCEREVSGGEPQQPGTEDPAPAEDQIPCDTKPQPEQLPPEDPGNAPTDNVTEEPGEEPVEVPNQEPGEVPDEESGDAPAENPGGDTGEEPGEKPGNEPGQIPGAEPGEDSGENQGENPKEDPEEQEPGQAPGDDPVEDPTEDPVPPPDDPAWDWGDDVADIVAGMTLREKVGQLFFVRPNALYEIATGDENEDAIVTSLSDGMAEALQRYPVSGIAMFWQNISGPEQITAFIAELQAASGIPLFIAADEEGGDIARLANNRAFDLPKFDVPAVIGESGDTDAALEMGRTIGGYMASFGFNMDFAPVADVNTNPDNPVIGDRAFSSVPLIAADMAEAMAQGLREQGVIPTFKHFPGHGDTGQDSHSGMAVTYKTQGEMELCEWIPFMRAGDTDCVMVGHITAPELSGDGLPATLSRDIVTGILRELLGFRGLIITDALEMGAIINDYGSEDAAIMAFNAGCDLLLMPGDFPEVFDAVMDAVESGQISAERLDESVERILTFKKLYLKTADSALYE